MLQQISNKENKQELINSKEGPFEKKAVTGRSTRVCTLNNVSSVKNNIKKGYIDLSAFTNPSKRGDMTRNNTGIIKYDTVDVESDYTNNNSKSRNKGELVVGSQTKADRHTEQNTIDLQFYAQGKHINFIFTPRLHNYETELQELKRESSGEFEKWGRLTGSREATDEERDSQEVNPNSKENSSRISRFINKKSEPTTPPLKVRAYEICGMASTGSSPPSKSRAVQGSGEEIGCLSKQEGEAIKIKDEAKERARTEYKGGRSSGKKRVSGERERNRISSNSRDRNSRNNRNSRYSRGLEIESTNPKEHYSSIEFEDVYVESSEHSSDSESESIEEHELPEAIEEDPLVEEEMGMSHASLSQYDLEGQRQDLKEKLKALGIRGSDMSEHSATASPPRSSGPVQRGRDRDSGSRDRDRDRDTGSPRITTNSRYSRRSQTTGSRASNQYYALQPFRVTGGAQNQNTKSTKSTDNWTNPQIELRGSLLALLGEMEDRLQKCTCELQMKEGELETLKAQNDVNVKSLDTYIEKKGTDLQIMSGLEKEVEQKNSRIQLILGENLILREGLEEARRLIAQAKMLLQVYKNLGDQMSRVQNCETIQEEERIFKWHLLANLMKEKLQETCLPFYDKMLTQIEEILDLPLTDLNGEIDTNEREKLIQMTKEYKSLASAGGNMEYGRISQSSNPSPSVFNLSDGKSNRSPPRSVGGTQKYKKQLDSLKSHNSLLVAKNEELEKYLNVLNEDKDSSNHNIYQGANEMYQLKKVNNELQDKISKLTQEISKTEIQKPIGKNRIEKLANVLKHIPVHKRIIQQEEIVRVKVLETEVDKLTGHISFLESEKLVEATSYHSAINQSQEKLLQMIESRNKGEEIITRLLTKISELTGELNVKQLQIHSLTSELRAPKNRLENMEREKQRLIEELEHERRDFNSRKQGIQDLFSDMTYEKQSLTEEVRVLEAKIKELTNAITQLEIDINVKNGEIFNLKGMLDQSHSSPSHRADAEITARRIDSAFQQLCLIILSKQKEKTLSREDQLLIRKLFGENFSQVIQTFHATIDKLDTQNMKLAATLDQSTAEMKIKLKSTESMLRKLIEVGRSYKELEDTSSLSTDLILLLEGIKTSENKHLKQLQEINGYLSKESKRRKEEEELISPLNLSKLTQEITLPKPTNNLKKYMSGCSSSSSSNLSFINGGASSPVELADRRLVGLTESTEGYHTSSNIKQEEKSLVIELKEEISKLKDNNVRQMTRGNLLEQKLKSIQGMIDENIGLKKLNLELKSANQINEYEKMDYLEQINKLKEELKREKTNGKINRLPRKIGARNNKIQFSKTGNISKYISS